MWKAYENKLCFVVIKLCFLPSLSFLGSQELSFASIYARKCKYKQFNPNRKRLIIHSTKSFSRYRFKLRKKKWPPVILILFFSSPNAWLPQHIIIQSILFKRTSLKLGQSPTTDSNAADSVESYLDSFKTVGSRTLTDLT